MAKIKKEEKNDEFNDFQKRKLTHIELRKLTGDIASFEGKGFHEKFMNFLISKGILNERKDGKYSSMSVFRRPELLGKEMIPGTGIVYSREIVYSDWLDIREQIEWFISKKEYAEKQEAKHHELQFTNDKL